MRCLAVCVLLVTFGFWNQATAQTFGELNPSFTPPSNVQFMGTGDLSGNGLEDLVFAYQLGLSHYTRVFAQKEPGVFQPGVELLTSENYTIRCMDVADANFDGKEEILAVFVHSNPMNGGFVAVRYASPLPPPEEPETYTTFSRHTFAFPEANLVSNCRFAPIRGTVHMDIVLTGDGLNTIGAQVFGYNTAADQWTISMDFAPGAPTMSNPFGITAGDYGGEGDRHLIIGTRDSPPTSHVYAWDPVNLLLSHEFDISGSGGHLESFELNGKDQAFGMLGTHNPSFSRIAHDSAGNWNATSQGFSVGTLGWVGRLRKTPSNVEFITSDPVNDEVTIRSFNGSNHAVLNGLTGAVADRQIIALDYTGDGRPGFAALSSSGNINWYSWSQPCSTIPITCLAGSECDGTICEAE